MLSGCGSAFLLAQQHQLLTAWEPRDISHQPLGSWTQRILYRSQFSCLTDSAPGRQNCSFVFKGNRNNPLGKKINKINGMILISHLQEARPVALCLPLPASARPACCTCCRACKGQREPALPSCPWHLLKPAATELQPRLPTSCPAKKGLHAVKPCTSDQFVFGSWVNVISAEYQKQLYSGLYDTYKLCIELGIN